MCYFQCKKSQSIMTSRFIAHFDVRHELISFVRQNFNIFLRVRSMSEYILISCFTSKIISTVKIKTRNTLYQLTSLYKTNLDGTRDEIS